MHVGFICILAVGGLHMKKLLLERRLIDIYFLDIYFRKNVNFAFLSMNSIVSKFNCPFDVELGLIRVALLLYPPRNRHVGPLPDPYPQGLPDSTRSKNQIKTL